MHVINDSARVEGVVKIISGEAISLSTISYVVVRKLVTPAPA